MAEIAVAGAVAVLRQAVAVLGNLLVQESSRLFNLKEDLEWIEYEMGYIQAYLEDADANYEQGRGNRVEATLLKNIRGLAYDVEDVVETYLAQTASQDRNGLLGLLKGAKGILNNYKTSHDFAEKIERIKRRVEDIKNARQTYGIRERSARNEGDVWDPRRSFPHIDEVNVIGFDKHIEELVAKVLDKDLQHPVISITGMAGLGKTTLAKKIYNSVLQRFECSAWICVSQQPNIAELLRDIARQVGLEKEKWEHNVEANLFGFLRHKRYVIVIDDLWQTEPWNALKNGIPNNFQSNSRIILTSRNKDVGIHVGGHSSLHELQPLDQENSRKLFFKMVKSPPSPENITESIHHPPPQIENIGEQILKRCGGVPLAIVLTAGMLLLRERTEHAWKGVLESIGQVEDQCSKIFALSYKDLPIELKPCFLYFGIFPEDYEIPAFNLVNLWVAEGFIRRGSGVQEIEEVGEDYLNHLIARNLIQVAQRNSNGRIRSCRIHDILHNLCVKVSEEINFFNTYNDIAAIGNSGTRVRRVTTYRRTLCEYISLGYRTPELRAMLCFERDNGRELKRKHVKNFLGDLRFLRVLSLEFDEDDGNIFLPNEFGNLTHLRYLQLKAHFGCIQFPSTISNLKSLLTLDVRRCYRVIIPFCIWKMQQLRHILLSSVKCGIVELLLNRGNFLHPVEASSLNLQTLYGFRFPHCITKYGFPKFTSLRKLGVYLWDDIDLLNVKTLLDNVAGVSNKLEILRLECNFYYININRLNLSRYENLFRLHLEGYTFELPEHDKLPPNLTKLTLVRTHLGEDPLEKLKKLRKLKILKLGKRSYMGQKMMVCSRGGEGHDSFPQLQVLEINQLFDLKELIVEEEAMPQLKALRITLSNPETRIPDRIRNIMISEY